MFGALLGGIALVGLNYDKPVDTQPGQPTIVQQIPLEVKLENVKTNLEDCLSENEYTMNELYDYTFSLLSAEGILEGERYSRENIELNVRIATKMTYNLGAEEYWGLEERYITLKDKNSLSDKVRSDLDNYQHIKDEVKEYLDQEKLAVEFRKWLKALEDPKP